MNMCVLCVVIYVFKKSFRSVSSRGQCMLENSAEIVFENKYTKNKNKMNTT